MLRRMLDAARQVRLYNRGELGYECLFLNVTSRCNSRCRYCEVHKLDPGRELSRERLFDLFEEARAAGIPHIYLSGGEPFLRRETFELIERILSLGLNWSAVSNGLLIEKFDQAQLDLVKRAQWIDISLESNREETHDFLRGGKGFLKRSTNGIDVLKRNGLSVNLNTTVCRQNYDDLAGVVLFARDHGVDYINFQPLHVWNNYHNVEADDKSDMLPTPEQVAGLPGRFKELLSLARKEKVRTNIVHVAPWMRQYFEHCLNEGALWMKKALNDFSCLEIADKIFVDADGSILPCALLGPSGNVLEESLPVLLEKMRPVRDRIRQGYFPPACNRCSCQMSINYKFSVMRSPLRNAGHLARYFTSLVEEKLSRIM